MDLSFSHLLSTDRIIEVLLEVGWRVRFLWKIVNLIIFNRRIKDWTGTTQGHVL